MEAERLNKAERRNRRRWNFSSHPRVLDLNTGILHGYLIDIQSSGMRMAGQQPTIPGMDYYLLVEIPRQGNHVGRVSLVATSVWTRRGPDRALPYESGFRFVQTLAVGLV